MPTYTILLFGPAATVIGTDRLVIDSSDSCTCAQLKAQIIQEFPALNEHLQIGRLAVNQSFVQADTQLNPSDEIALITMVSGG